MATSQDTLRILQVLETPQLMLDVRAFLLDAQARNLSAGTLRFYQQKLYPLVRYLQEHGVSTAEQATPTVLRQWVVDLQVGNHNAGGVHAYYRAAKAFFSWLSAEEAIGQNPMRRVRSPKVPEEPLQPVTPDQIRSLLRVCDRHSQTGARDTAIILALWDSGCRAAEFVALDNSDIDLQSGALLVRSGKGRKPRVTFLGAKSRRELLRYLRLRGETPATAPLFATDGGTRLSYTGLRDIIRRRAGQAGIAAPSLHSFRRGFALASLQNGADVYSLQKMMGHADLSTLRRYLRQTECDLQRVHEKSGPVDVLLV